eukprot:272743-Chlamydomonas_euryale.AAC.1
MSACRSAAMSAPTVDSSAAASEHPCGSSSTRKSELQPSKVWADTLRRPPSRPAGSCTSSDDTAPPIAGRDACGCV